MRTQTILVLLLSLSIESLTSAHVTMKPNPFKKNQKPMTSLFGSKNLAKSQTPKSLMYEQIGLSNVNVNDPKKYIFSMDNIDNNKFQGLVYQEIDMTPANRIQSLDNNFENEPEEAHQEADLPTEQQKILDENLFLVFRHGMRTPMLPESMRRRAEG